ncbi:hypothetical protein BH23BAC1_BH23BAC1_14590 [soil metagenome]
MAKDHGLQIKDDEQYEALRRGRKQQRKSCKDSQ